MQNIGFSMPSLLLRTIRNQLFWRLYMHTHSCEAAHPIVSHFHFSSRPTFIKNFLCRRDVLYTLRSLVDILWRFPISMNAWCGFELFCDTGWNLYTEIPFAATLLSKDVDLEQVQIASCTMALKLACRYPTGCPIKTCRSFSVTKNYIKILKRSNNFKKRSTPFKAFWCV